MYGKYRKNGEANENRNGNTDGNVHGTGNGMAWDVNPNLEAVFKRVGRRYGYGNVRASYDGFTDFKVRWQRSTGWINFQVSDYLSDAPDEVLEGIAGTLFGRITGRDGEDGYPEVVRDWLTNPMFPKTKRDVFLERIGRTEPGTMGEERDLRDSYDRLRESGLIRDMEDVDLRWYHGNGYGAGRSSVLMRSAIVSDALDSEGIPDEIVDYVLYMQLANIARGFDPGADGTAAYSDMLSWFGGGEEIEGILRGMGLMY